MAMYYRGKDYEATEEKQQLDRDILSILWKFAKPFRGWLVVAFFVMLLGTSAELLRPYLLKLAIDEQIMSHDLIGLKYTAWLYGASIVVSFALSYGQTVLLQYVGQRIIFDLRQKVFCQLLYQRYAALESQTVGRMVTRVTNDTDAIRDLYTEVLVAFVSDLLVLLGIIFAMLLIDWQLALVSFAVLPVMFALAVLYQRYARSAYRQVREKTSSLNTYIQESLNGISVVKSFARFRQTQAEYKAISNEYLAAGLKEMRTFAVFRPLVDLVYTLAIVLVLWFSDWHFTSGVEAGVVVAFLRYVEKFFWPIKDLAEKYSLLQSALAAAERVWDLISADAPEALTNEGATPRKLEGEICFEHVWFAYEEPQWVLEDVTFTIKPGSFTGIAGLSGSGKSTLLSLLLRFYEPQQGRITIGGVDIADIPLEDLRNHVAVVFQDVHLFKGSISDNIRLYHPDVDELAVKRSARSAHIDHVIENMPDGYETPVGYQGSMLSMGERQLLSLARALAANKAILALDEATSSIDSETENSIQDVLEQIAGKCTMIVVAHRLSTIANADAIIVMHHGQVIEQGCHQALLERQGFYFRLYNSQ